MVDPKQVLSAEDWRDYRNVRAIAAFFVVLGGVFVLCGVSAMGDPNVTRVGKAFMAVLAGFGLAGAAAGIGALKGGRRWAPLVRLVTTPCLFGFPVWTIPAYKLLSRFPRYLDSHERIKAAEAALLLKRTAPRSRQNSEQ